MIDVEMVLAGAWKRDSAWHGEEHWRCVVASGLALADALAGCDREVVFCFALLHDTRRENEHRDPDHGPRATAYASELAAAGALGLEAARLALLCGAIELHSNGLVSDDPAIGACWDADRLHLPRVGIASDPELFSTPAALGSAPLEAAERLRTGPPGWAELVSLV
jgi:uncharacterized protein